MKKWVINNLGAVRDNSFKLEGGVLLLDDTISKKYYTASKMNTATVMIGSHWVSMDLQRYCEDEPIMVRNLGYVINLSVYTLVFVVSGNYVILVLDGLTGKLVGVLEDVFCEYVVACSLGTASEDIQIKAAKHALIRGINILGKHTYEMRW